MRVLIVEDEQLLGTSLRRGLQAEGFDVDVANDGDEGFWLASEGAYDAIVLDIMLPQRNGFRVCADLRSEENWTPILMLTAKRGELDETEALDAGADGYLRKPFSFSVLVAHLRAILRRGAGPDRQLVDTAGDLRVDASRHRCWRGEVEVPLTHRELGVLSLLVRRCPDVVTKQDLLDNVWDFDYQGDSNIVEVYVARLRKKIDEPFGCRTIKTVRGAGYRFEPSG